MQMNRFQKTVENKSQGYCVTKTSKDWECCGSKFSSDY